MEDTINHTNNIMKYKKPKDNCIFPSIKINIESYRKNIAIFDPNNYKSPTNKRKHYNY